MKLSEVIAELENGSTKTYAAYYDDGTRIIMSPDNPKLGLGWSPVKTPVEWNEAIREWALGKKICCELRGMGGTVVIASDSEDVNNYEFSITPRMIKFGVWYVED